MCFPLESTELNPPTLQTLQRPDGGQGPPAPAPRPGKPASTSRGAPHRPTQHARTPARASSRSRGGTTCFRPVWKVTTPHHCSCHVAAAQTPRTACTALRTEAPRDTHCAKISRRPFQGPFRGSRGESSGFQRPPTPPDLRPLPPPFEHLCALRRRALWRSSASLLHFEGPCGHAGPHQVAQDGVPTPRSAALRPEFPLLPGTHFARGRRRVRTRGAAVCRVRQRAVHRSSAPLASHLEGVQRKAARLKVSSQVTLHVMGLVFPRARDKGL